jgi:putative addiction module component (TIGR02574 family)
MTKQQIIDSAKQLPRDEQIDLAAELWDAIEVSNGDFPLSEEQKAELDRRIAESDSNPQPAEDVESLKARVLRGDF